jgi:hypothetical protein
VNQDIQTMLICLGCVLGAIVATYIIKWGGKD